MVKTVLWHGVRKWWVLAKQVTVTKFLVCKYVTVSAKTVLNGTFSITRKTDLKYSSCCSSVVLDLSYARLTV